MVQAARSGKQNILEGSKAGKTSKEMEIKLTNVARASLEELLADYRDFLRVRDFAIWDKDSRESIYVRNLSRDLDGRDGSHGKQGRSSHASPSPHSPHQTPEEVAALFKNFTQTRPAETIANIAICLIHQANFLLDRQVLRLEQDFLKNGGLREAMTRARLRVRGDRGNPPR